MPNKTSIGWCDYSSNPIRYRDRETGREIWVCEKDSSGCRGCYAEARALAWDRGRPFTHSNLALAEPFIHEGELRQLLTSKALFGKRVFVGDMTDIFGDWIPDDFLLRLFEVFCMNGSVTFQLLTKRAERLPDFAAKQRWWPSRIWTGVSTEDQRNADRRIPHLLEVPAPIKFLSAEPLLGPIDLSPWLDQLQWVVVGGESGPGFRPMELTWLTDIADQCRQAGVACYVKQDSHRHPGRQGQIPDAYWSLREFPSTAS